MLNTSEGANLGMGSFQIDVPLLSQRMSVLSMNTPTQKRLGSWDMESFKRQAIHESSPSDVSSREYFDAEENVRISNTMEQLKAALAHHKQAGFDEEYQSSEEALSPMLQDEATTTEEDELEELTTDDEDGGVEIMDVIEAKSVKVEMARAIPVAISGKAQVVNVNIPQRWSASRGRQSELYPTRSSSRSTSIATTSNARASSVTRTPPRIDTNVSRTSTSSGSISPTEMKYMRSATFSASHRAVSSVTSSGSFVAKSARGERTNVALFEFLKEDPYKMPRRESAPQPQPQPLAKSSTKSRLRAVSSRLMASLNTSSLDLSTAPDVTVYPQRRRSLIGASRTAPSSRPETATTPFFFSQRSREAWERENASPRSRPRSSTPTTLSATTPTQPRFPKLVARAANERAPMPELPPCPKDYDMDVPQLSRFETLPGHIQAARKSSVPNLKRRQSLLGMRA